MPSLLLAIDQGTTNTKALLVDHAGRPVFRASRSVPLLAPCTDRIEQDLNAIWNSVVEVVAECIAHAGKESIVGVALSNQRETAAAWDRATSTPLCNAISWQCRRSTDICCKVASCAELIRMRSGLPLDPLLSATKWAWLLEKDMTFKARAAAGEICFGTIDSWLIWKLSAGTAFATDHSNASRTGLLSLESLDWDRELLTLFDIPLAVMPSLVPSCGVIAKVIALPELAGVPILSSLGDSHAALAGHGSFSAGTVKATYGTGSSLMTLTSGLPAPTEKLARTIAWTINGTTQYALEGNITMTGSGVQWVGEFLGLADAVGDTVALADTVDSSAGVFFVPAMAGLGAPHWDARARGTISGLGRSSTRAHLARAAVEAIAFQVADVFGAMQAIHATPMTRLFTDGGATRNDGLMQMQADVLGLPVERAACEDLSALGAAWLAGHALHWWPTIDDLETLPEPTARFTPKPFDHSRYDQWQLAVHRARLAEAYA